MSTEPARYRVPREGRLSADAGIPADDVAVVQDALEGLLGRHPDLRGAAVYPMAHGQVMVRLFTARGWIPALVRAGDLRCWKVLLARLEAATADSPSSRSN